MAMLANRSIASRGIVFEMRVFAPESAMAFFDCRDIPYSPQSQP
jgi:hypothetical protein